MFHVYFFYNLTNGSFNTMKDTICNMYDGYDLYVYDFLLKCMKSKHLLLKVSSFNYSGQKLVPKAL